MPAAALDPAPQPSHAPAPVNAEYWPPGHETQLACPAPAYAKVSTGNIVS